MSRQRAQLNYYLFLTLWTMPYTMQPIIYKMAHFDDVDLNVID